MRKLTPVTERFILHWGEMGTRWGINRTVAQISALLYISADPLNAEEIADTLNVARSNVSTSLRELQNWDLVQVVHKMGDRRDHFQIINDPWELFRVVIEERKRRELDPTIEVLRQCVEEIERGKEVDDYARRQLLAMEDFFETIGRTWEQIRGLPTRTITKFAKLGDRVSKMIRSAAGR